MSQPKYTKDCQKCFCDLAQPSAPYNWVPTNDAGCFPCSSDVRSGYSSKKDCEANKQNIQPVNVSQCFGDTLWAPNESKTNCIPCGSGEGYKTYSDCMSNLNNPVSISCSDTSCNTCTGNGADPFTFDPTKCVENYYRGEVFSNPTDYSALGKTWTAQKRYQLG